MENNKLINTTIFVKPHIRKFLLSHADPLNRIVIDYQGKSAAVFNPIILMFFNKKRSFYSHSQAEKAIQIDSSFVPVQVQISVFVFEKFGALIRDCDHIRLNSILDDIFRSMLYAYVLASKMYSKTSVINAISDFCSIFDISDEDISADTLQRFLFRKGLN